MSRFALGQWLLRDGWLLPLGTLAANTLGCFIIGLLSQSGAVMSSPSGRALWLAGFCGGFTTMSALVFDANKLFREATLLQAGFYVTLTLVLCFLAFMLGALLGRSLYRA